ncbi:MAG: TIGR03960 family B12-binding radical SAM protein [Coriobacteriales bacterium]|nr:TIGR03960 family B12-binding radical SAM protein [Coriobacteriales bacterium]
MRPRREDRFEEIEPLLGMVEHPSRYLDHEWGACPDQSGPFYVCLIYADVYEVGQPNLGLAILYNELNAAEGISCERAYLPWVDMSGLMRERGIPLLSLESSSAVASFDMVGITLAHELVATNIVETLDLAGITIEATKRDEDEPIVVAGGPSAWNCEPVAPMFDAVLLGDGEHVVVRMAQCVREARSAGASRADILLRLSRIPGVYVPSLYDIVVDETSTRWGYAVPRKGTGAPEVVYKHCIGDLASTDPLAQQIVPYMSVVQDRLAVEVLRGCARGCRFCQAGMTYRPVRERPASQVIDAVRDGLAMTGYDECSLSSLSTTDHSECAHMVRALNDELGKEGVRVSIPSQRLDSFGVDMATAVGSSRRAGLTFAPEAGSQRMRDVINKNVTDEDLERAAQNAFASGYRRMKLYFMMGLPTETDDDVVGIPQTALKVIEVGRRMLGPRSKVSVSISVAVFVPKPHTPFQWSGQLPLEEVHRRQQLLLHSAYDRSVRISYHDAETSLLEGALSKMGRKGFELVYEAWRGGCRFDAWTDQFDFDAWRAAAARIGVDLEDVACEEFDVDARLPWDHTSPGVSKGYLQREWRKAMRAEVTPDCTRESCTGCGVCPTLHVQNQVVGERQ